MHTVYVRRKKSELKSHLSSFDKYNNILCINLLYYIILIPKGLIALFVRLHLLNNSSRAAKIFVSRTMWAYIYNINIYLYLASYNRTVVYTSHNILYYMCTIHVYYTAIAKTNHFFGVHLLFFHPAHRIHLFLLKHLQIVLHNI